MCQCNELEFSFNLPPNRRSVPTREVKGEYLQLRCDRYFQVAYTQLYKNEFKALLTYETVMRRIKRKLWLSKVPNYRQKKCFRTKDFLL